MQGKFLMGAVAAVVISGAGLAQAGPLAHLAADLSPASHPASTQPAAAHLTGATHAKAPKSAARSSASPSDPATAWLESAGGQAQVTFNDEVATLAVALQTEDQSPTVANHLVFEADARTVRAEAEKILATPSLLPSVNRAGYTTMLNDFVTVANLLQPGPGYGTTAQDWTAWNAAVTASDSTVS